jgi:hypothetical protein
MNDRSALETPRSPSRRVPGLREIKVIALADEKVYDGNVYSTKVPVVVGELADDHVAIVTQKYKDKKVGETVLVPKVRITDRHGKPVDYVVIVQNAAGKIKPRLATVWAETDTKEYDGTTLSTVFPPVDNLAHGDTAIASQEFDTPNVGGRKALTPSVKIKDGNEGKNYEVILNPIHTGTILSASEVKPETLKAIAGNLGTEDFTVTNLHGFSDFTGEVCSRDDKKVYLKLEARKRIQLVIEMQHVHQELAKAEIGKKLHVVIKGKKIEIQGLGNGSSSLSTVRHCR